MRKHISQAEARRLKRRVAELEYAMDDRDTVVERYHLTNWDMGDTSRILPEVKTAMKMNFRVEVVADGNLLKTYAVRRKDQQG